MENKEKIAFDNYEDAFSELQRIVNTNYKLTDKKPNRVYEQGGKYYLTSQPKIHIYEK